ncbi:hypothetical protein [Micromonospora zamorensis]|uniref:hypothetical protein n=1 Tax=Micromonospora zamorensis TaxID=709883 RepID=UPI0033EEA783
MIDDLEAFFGPGWLHKAVRPANGVAGPTMRPYFASLMGIGAFGNVAGLWARLQYLVDAATPGVGHLRRNLRANPVADEFRHHLALARLAVQAKVAGASVMLEPSKPQGGPGDLRAVRASSDVFLELRTLGPDKKFLEYNQQVDQAQAFLRQLEHRHGVHFDGELAHEPTDQWREAVSSAAQKSAADSATVEVALEDATLTVRPGPAPAGTVVSGPVWAADQGPRLLRALVAKAVKTESAGAAWLWLEDAGALWPLSAFAQDSLPRKEEALRQALDPLFDAHPHVLGVVLTSGQQRVGTPGNDIDHVGHRGVAFRRTLPGGLMRESVVVHRRLAVPWQYFLMAEMCADEPAWLDRALDALGVPGGLAALTMRPAPPTKRWSSEGPRPSSLYLPSWAYGTDAPHSSI